MGFILKNCSMIKRVLLCIILLVFGFRSFAQTDSIIILDTLIAKNSPYIVLKMNTSNILIDTSDLKRIDPGWIKKVEILKDKKYKNIYDPPPGEATVLIYIKRRYIKEVKNTILKE
jgi:hypothetical protein